jgi:hypothetical protein
VPSVVTSCPALDKKTKKFMKATGLGRSVCKAIEDQVSSLCNNPQLIDDLENVLDHNGNWDKWSHKSLGSDAYGFLPPDKDFSCKIDEGGDNPLRLLISGRRIVFGTFVDLVVMTFPWSLKIYLRQRQSRFWWHFSNVLLNKTGICILLALYITCFLLLIVCFKGLKNSE